MQIPEHWAEARIEGKVNGRKRVIRRFGWSDVSEVEARENAERRAHDAMRELQSGKQVAQREAKLAYGGVGLPIREQILAKNGDVVITRNSYGAHCLNVPDVLFADVDDEWEDVLSRGLKILSCVGGAAGLALILSQHLPRSLIFCCALPLGAVIGMPVIAAIVRRLQSAKRIARKRDRFRSVQLERIRAVVAKLDGARIALYETPRGWRLLALHRTFEPRSAASRDVLQAFRSDRKYEQMCELQACFRARVSGKPWRMNVRRIRPPGVWPVLPERRALRDAWVEEYEAAAVNFAACRYLEDLGTGRVHPRCAEVQRIHDELSRARTDLPLA